MYTATKVYDHSEGLSCSFRQWRAESHCRLLHGYALKVTLVFAATKLDSRNWVVDFGGLKWVKEWLHGTFDHVLAVARDDPQLALMEALARADCARLVYLERVGCEAFAQHIGEYVSDNLRTENDAFLTRVEVSEHTGNTASWINFKRIEVGNV